MMSKFVHLHVHTEYSLLDGLSNIEKLFVHIKENNMDSVAITDHGVMYGEIEFYKEALKQGVKPILGMEGYITSGDLHDRLDRTVAKNYHLLLLAKNHDGYQNLMKLASIAHLEGFYYKPRFDRETLKKYSSGLIVSSACPAGEVGQSLINDNYNEAKKIVEWYLDVFKDDYYLEVQRHEYTKYVNQVASPEIKSSLLNLQTTEDKWNEGILKLSREFGVPIIATNDAHYIKQKDAAAQDVLVCVATGKTMNDTKRMRYIDAPTFYLRSPEEMQSLFPDLPDAVENTVKVAQKCNVELSLGSSIFPIVSVAGETDLNKYLRDQVLKRIPLFYPKIDKNLLDRINFELDTIVTKSLAQYFLMIADITNWCTRERIIFNTRGSAAGSVVSYILGITTVDPIKYLLPFERFLNPYRPSAPDIDLDVADDRREEIIEYITKTYGKDKVAQICTFGRMLSRAAVRDVARVLGYPYGVGDKIAKLIPPPKQGFPITIDKALSEVPELKQLYDSDSDTKKVLDLALQTEGSARHVSVHAAAVVVAPKAIVEYTPLQLDPKGGKIITQYEMHSLIDEYAGVGLVKIDVLGIRNLSILGLARDLVEKVRKIKIDLRKIPLDDKKTFEMLSRGETMGTFQLGGSGMTKWLKELKPDRVEDIMNMVAIYRPGPMANIPEYIARKNGKSKITYMHPKMEKFLDKSYGILVYQDDILFTALELAGYTWETVDKFRKAIGKKLPKEMAEQHVIFVEGCMKTSGMTKEEAEKLWDLFVPFQGYGFNKAHAASYGILAYQTAYMKANYPVEYMTALLTAESGDTEKVSAAINECRRMKIKVLPPDINESNNGFTIVKDSESLSGKAIRFGFSAVKNVGGVAIDIILEARKMGNFESFSDFVGRVDARKVNKRVLESLIKVGAFSKFGGRSSLLGALDKIREKMVKPKGDDNQQGLFAVEDIKTSSTSEAIVIENIKEFSDDELESLERELLGFSLSAKPIIDLIGPLEFQSTHKIFEISPEEKYPDLVKIAGVVTEVRVITTKKSGAEMAFAKVEDGTGTLELVVFPKVFNDTRDFWIAGQPLLITGKVDVRDDSPNLLVEKVETINSLGEKDSAEVYIKVPEGADVNSLKRLKTLLTENPGEQKAILMFAGGKKINLPFKISWNESLAKEITEILENKSS